jgi:tetratricopeptide (TPR) repeat protein
MIRRASSELRALLCAIACSASAAAQAAPNASESVEPSPRSRSESIEPARAHFARGVAFYNNGDYKLALVEFRRAHELSSNYRVLYNIGQVNHLLGNYTKALAALERYLHEGGDDVPAERRGEVSRSLADLRMKTVRVRLRLNVPSAEIVVDQSSQGTLPDGHVMTIDGGEHRVEARRAGYRGALAQLTLSGGGTTDVALRLVQNAPAARAPDAPRDGGRSAWLWAGWSTAGVSAAGAVVTGLFAVSASNELESQRRSPGSTAEERESTAARARGLALASDVFTGVALVSGAASLYLSLSGGSERAGPPRRSTALGLGPRGISFAYRY